MESKDFEDYQHVNATKSTYSAHQTPSVCLLSLNWYLICEKQKVHARKVHQVLIKDLKSVVKSTP